MKTSVTITLLASLLLFTPWKALALDWKNDRVRIEATPLDEKAEARFRFSNNSKKPVTITSIHSSCGCTVPNLEKRTYAPGEDGEIKAVFSFGGRTGLQVKTITVETDEDTHSNYQLTLEVDIPKLFSVDRHFVIWRRGDEPSSKTIIVTAHDPDLATLTGVESGDARVSAEIKKADDPKEYAIVITVAETATALQAPIVIKTSFPEDNPRVLTVYALVR